MINNIIMNNEITNTTYANANLSIKVTCASFKTS